MKIEECYFFNNSNLKGGALFFAGNEKFFESYFVIERSIFKKNDAGEGGAGMHFSQSLRFIKANITQCYFSNSLAWSIEFIFCFLFSNN